MPFMASLTRMTGTARELWAFMKVRKRWWLLPILVIMGAFAVFISIAEGSAAAPFLYTIF